MKIEFADSFWKSLKTLSRHQTWWYKTYEFFRRDLPYFLENIWFFRKELYKFRSWDYSYNLEMFRRSLEKTVNTIEFHGNEIDKSRLKKVKKMKRSIQLINNIRSDEYVNQAETELGKIKNSDWLWTDKEDTEEEKIHNRKVFDRSREIEDSEWKELWSIIHGQDLKEYREIYNSKTDEEKREEDVWTDWFDGSGMNGWWD
jgi:biotin operon repressor